jgi:hypothetical protein
MASSIEQINALVERFGLSETVKQEIVKIVDIVNFNAYEQGRYDLYNELEEKKL